MILPRYSLVGLWTFLFVAVLSRLEWKEQSSRAYMMIKTLFKNVKSIRLTDIEKSCIQFPFSHDLGIFGCCDESHISHVKNNNLSFLKGFRITL